MSGALPGRSSRRLFLSPPLHTPPPLHALHAFHPLHVPHRHALHAFHPFHALHAALSHVHPFHAFHLAFIGTAHLPIAHTDPSHHGLHARGRCQLALRIQHEICRGHNPVPFFESLQHFHVILASPSQLDCRRLVTALPSIHVQELAEACVQNGFLGNNQPLRRIGLQDDGSVH